MNVGRNASRSDRALIRRISPRAARWASHTLFPLYLIVAISEVGFAEQQLKPLADRIAAANALYEEQNQSDMRDFPLNATVFGDYRYNDKLTDYSLNGYRQRNEIDSAYLARIEAISTQGFSDKDRLSHDVMAQILRQRIANYSFKEHEIPLNLDISIHLRLATLAQRVPLDSVKHYEDYIARLHQLPIALQQITELLRAGTKDGIVPVRFIVEKMANQCQGVVDANPFLLAIKKYPPGISPEDQARLTQQINQAANSEAIPAYKDFTVFLRAEYAPHGRTALAVTSLPDGQRRYQNEIASMTTTQMTPDEIHQLGVREVELIEGEMLVIAKQQGFADLPSFQASLKTNPKYIPTSEEQVLDSYRRYIAQMNDKLPQLFTVRPKMALTVEALPSFQSTSSTQYAPGSLDGNLPGRVLVNVANLSRNTTVTDEATAYHEGLPGHHLQNSIARQITGLPVFRTHLNGFTAYAEGWGLYAEQLGKEAGFYQDPVSDFGRLSSELFRAVRLVVDTGIHSKGWTRDQVVAYFRTSGAIEEPLIQSETDRYIANPAQALAYKVGQLKFRELRDRSQKELGPRFDIRRFHDEMLDGGALPLGLLDQRTNEWIAEEKTRATVSAMGN
jgi:uncharacterized protein (DUF885 family)